jgi:hypothetical protein
MGKKIETMTPDQIAAKGRELIRLARKKEAELHQHQLVQIGEIFRREIQTDWPSTWESLSEELERIVGKKVSEPHWIQKA